MGCTEVIMQPMKLRQGLGVISIVTSGQESMQNVG